MMINSTEKKKNRERKETDKEVEGYNSKHIDVLGKLIQLFATLWNIACQATLSMGFSRQEYWSESPCSPPGGLPNPGTKPESLTSPALAGMFFTTSAILPGGSDSKETACNAGDPGLMPGLGRVPREGTGTHSSILAWRIP